MTHDGELYDADAERDRVHCGRCKKSFDITLTYEVADESVCVDCAEDVIATLVDLTRWRPFPAEKPPIEGEEYLVRRAHGTPRVCRWAGGVWNFELPPVLWFHYDHVTHWMPISPLPGEASGLEDDDDE